MDKFDRAQCTDELLREAALAQQSARYNAPGAEFEHCQECGEQIPEQRREAIRNCSTCADCQQLIEEKQKHYRR